MLLGRFSLKVVFVEPYVPPDYSIRKLRKVKITEVCENYYSVVFNYTAYQYRHVDAEDLTQDIFLSALRSWQPCQETWSKSKILGWLLRIGMSQASREMRRMYQEESFKETSGVAACRGYNGKGSNAQGDRKSVTTRPLTRQMQTNSGTYPHLTV